MGWVIVVEAERPDGPAARRVGLPARQHLDATDAIASPHEGCGEADAGRGPRRSARRPLAPPITRAALKVAPSASGDHPVLVWMGSMIP